MNNQFKEIERLFNKLKVGYFTCCIELNLKPSEFLTGHNNKKFEQFFTSNLGNKSVSWELKNKIELWNEKIKIIHSKDTIIEKYYLIVNFLSVKPAVHEIYFYDDHKNDHIKNLSDEHIQIKNVGQRHGKQVLISELINELQKYDPVSVDKSIESRIREDFREFILLSFFLSHNPLNFNLKKIGCRLSTGQKLTLLKEKSKLKPVKHFDSLKDIMLELITKKDIEIMFSNSTFNKRHSVTYAGCEFTDGPIHILKRGFNNYPEVLCAITRNIRNPTEIQKRMNEYFLIYDYKKDSFNDCSLKKVLLNMISVLKL